MRVDAVRKSKKKRPSAKRGRAVPRRQGRPSRATTGASADGSTVDKLLNEEQRERSLASLRRKRERDARRASGVQQSREKIVREVIIPEVITIQELANRMSEKAVDVIRLLMKQGAMHKINDVIDADTAELIVTEFGHTVRRVSEADVEEGFIGAQDDEQNLESAGSGGDDHGPRRPRQDVAARRHSRSQCGDRRGGRHHAAYRRLSGGEERSKDHVHRYAGP